MSGERSVVGAAISGDGRAVAGTVVRMPGTRAMASGAEPTVPGEGALPLRAEGRHLEREFLDVHQKLVIIRRLANARERGRGTVSVMWSAQSATASSSTLNGRQEWPVLWLVQMVCRK
jgi:hypothetical protein